MVRLLLGAVLLTAPAAGTQDAQWIWKGSPARPQERLFFRKSFEVGAVESARVHGTADNRFVLYVNGQEAARSDDWTAPVWVDLAPHLQPGKNVLAVEASNDDGPAGLLLRFLIRTADGKSLTFGTDAGWKVSDRADPGWSMPTYDDSAWAPAAVLGPPGIAPWGDVLAGQPAASEASAAPRDALRARDLPGMADIDASLYLFCKEIKKEATVGLSGECADEIFGGYPWFHREDALTVDTFPWSRSLAERVRLLSPELTAVIRPLEYVAERYRQDLAEVPRLDGEPAPQARIREVFYLNLTRWMPTLLDRKDRMSMAVGLEVRVPFCDHRLVEYTWNIPWELKSAGGRPKGLLRRALAGILPPDVLERPKSPYPKTHNPAYLAAMRNRVRAILDDPASPLLPLVDASAVRALTEAGGEAMDRPWFGQLMRGPQLLAFLVQIDTWLREYRITLRLNGESAGSGTARRRRTAGRVTAPAP